jgi:hypothetical protein
MVAVKKSTDEKVEKAEKRVYGVRPKKGAVDYTALRKDVMKRYAKARAHLAK